MNHTETYNFNLIESSDTFSPAPLNENMELVEEQLDAVRAEGVQGDAALDQRLKVLEARRFAYDTYTGTGGVRTFSLGFAPDLVFIHGASESVGVSALATRDHSYSGAVLTLTSSGFSVSGYARGFNVSGSLYTYFAIKW